MQAARMRLAAKKNGAMSGPTDPKQRQSEPECRTDRGERWFGEWTWPPLAPRQITTPVSHPTENRLRRREQGVAEHQPTDDRTGHGAGAAASITGLQGAPPSSTVLPMPPRPPLHRPQHRHHRLGGQRSGQASMSAAGLAGDRHPTGPVK
jgi:hypothetical protein